MDILHEKHARAKVFSVNMMRMVITISVESWKRPTTEFQTDQSFFNHFTVTIEMWVINTAGLDGLDERLFLI